MSLQMVAPSTPHERDVEFFFKLAFAFGVAVTAFEIGYLVRSPWPFDPSGDIIGHDYINTWIGARLALSGDPAPWLGLDHYRLLIAEQFGPTYPLRIWSYPPHLLLFTWPLGLLPYMSGYWLYCAFGLALWVFVATEGTPRLDEKLVLLVVSPATVLNIWHGQNGFFTAAILIGGLTMLDRRPILAGVLFGTLSIKPQLGVLLPLVLALQGRWRTIAAAASTIAVLIAATTAIFGFKVWTAYWYDAMPTQAKIVLDGFAVYMVHMPTAFMNAKTAGLSLPAASIIQVLVSAATLVGVIWTFWRRRDHDLSNAFLVTAIFTVTPYAFNYDMVMFGWVMIKLMDRPDNEPWDYRLMLAVWVVPFFTVSLGLLDVPVSCLPILVFGARLLWRMRKQEKSAAQESVLSPEAALA